MRHSIITLLLLALALHADAQLGDSPILFDRIDQYLQASVANGFSASVLVAQNGEILLSKGYGYADRNRKIPNTPSTVFNIGSVTKQFTAAGILKLSEQKRLSLSDSLYTFFPNIPSDKASITLHQLLTHTSGISPASGGFRYHSAEKEVAIREILSTELPYPSGTKHTYANANYILLAAIIELTANLDYESFLINNFFEPLQMNHTGYRNLNEENTVIAHGYYFDDTQGNWQDWGITKGHLPEGKNHWYSIGKGDIQSSVIDLYKWHIALQNNLLLTPKSKALLEHPHVPENDESTSFYGYGWAIFKNSKNRKIVTHNGSNGIYFADFIRLIEDDLVIIVLANKRLNTNSENVAWEIARMALTPDYQPKPIGKNTHELVFDFIRNNNQNKSAELIPLLKEHIQKEQIDKSIFNRIGYKQIAEGQDPAWGIELLRLNTLLYPEDGNLWDSLGEGYFLLNENQNAKTSFQKALDLKPEENCYWCEHAIDRLKEINQSK